MKNSHSESPPSSYARLTHGSVFILHQQTGGLQSIFRTIKLADARVDVVTVPVKVIHIPVDKRAEVFDVESGSRRQALNVASGDAIDGPRLREYAIASMSLTHEQTLFREGFNVLCDGLTGYSEFPGKIALGQPNDALPVSVMADFEVDQALSERHPGQAISLNRVEKQSRSHTSSEWRHAWRRFTAWLRVSLLSGCGLDNHSSLSGCLSSKPRYREKALPPLLRREGVRAREFPNSLAPSPNERTERW